MAEWSFVPYLVSEREVNGWEDCTWASGVMWANAARNANVSPATRAEYEGLRAATGYLHAEPVAGEKKGGSIDDLVIGIRNRYDLGGQKVTSWGSFMEQWRPGAIAVLQGMNGKLPSGARGGSTYTGPHAIFCEWKTSTGSTIVLNPLAANGSRQVAVEVSALKTFFEALPGAAALMGFVGQEMRKNPMNTWSLERWKVNAGHPIYEYPGGPQVTSVKDTREITTIGIPMDRVKDGTPYLVGGWRTAIMSTRALDGTLARKQVYLKTSGLTKVATDPGWDDRVLATILDPGKIGEVIVKTVPDQAQLDIEFNKGVTEAALAAQRVVSTVGPAVNAATTEVRR